MAHLKRSVTRMHLAEPFRLMGKTENVCYVWSCSCVCVHAHACVCGLGGCVWCDNLPVTETLGWHFLFKNETFTFMFSPSPLG